MSYTDFSFSSWKASMNVRKVDKNIKFTNPQVIVTVPSCNTGRYCDLDGKETCTPAVVDSCPNLTISVNISDYNCTDNKVDSCGNFRNYGNELITTCTEQVTSTCGNIDKNSNCTLGKYGTGVCRSPCKIQVIPPSTQINNADSGDWGIYGKGDFSKSWGWIFCTYEFDYSSYDLSKMYGLYQWISDIYTNLKNNTPTSFWAGPIGSADDQWQGYNYCDGSPTFGSLDGAKAYAESTNCCGGTPYSIMVSPDSTSYQLRCGSAVEEQDSAGFGNSVYNRKNNDPILTPIYINMFRDSVVVYSIINLVYNMIYSTGVYSTVTVSNPFENCTFLQGSFSDWRNSIISDWIGTIAPLYPSFPQILQNSLQKIILLPVPNQNKDSYSMILNLSYEQYNKYSTNTDKNGIISGYLKNLLKDSKGELVVNGNSQPINDPIVITNPANDTFTIINLSDFSTQSGISPTAFPMSDPKYFFASAQITVEIQKWSPMLLLYFSNIGNNIQFSQTVCNQIKSDSGVYPLVGYQSLCSVVTSPDICKNIIMQNCIVSYYPPSNTGDRTVSDSFILSGNCKDCRCYNSYLPPVSVNPLGNPGAMCFDINCDTRMKTFFGLNNSTCGSYCNEVWNWMNSSGQDHSRNPGEFNSAAFSQVCGINYQPTTNSQYNRKVLISSSFITIFSSMLVFLFCKYKKFSTIQTIIATLTALIILGFISGFLSIDLAGKGSCKNYSGKFVCRTKITNKEISPQFCTFRENCECGTDADCPGSCICASSTCIPKVGERQFKMVQKSDIDILNTVTIPICTILIIGCVIYANKTYSFSNKIFYGILTSIALLGITSLVLVLTKKSKVQEFTGPCCSPKCDGTKCNIDDECGGKCKCYEGTTCCGTTCIDNSTPCNVNTQL